MKGMQPHIQLARNLWKNLLNLGDLAIDATCGNGNDTLFLSELCSVIGIDIQQDAIESTEKLLTTHGKTAVLHRLSHDKIDELPLPYAPRLIVYNLGYLPKGDKKITTMTETTLLSVHKSLDMLPFDGALSITCYPGHEEGKKEENAILTWAKTLRSDKWLICHYQWINRKEAPSLLWIQTLKD